MRIKRTVIWLPSLDEAEEFSEQLVIELAKLSEKQRDMAMIVIEEDEFTGRCTGLSYPKEPK